ncbi:O-antigen ligase family protein [Paenibacillus sp. 481]|uniref:O-antigen ligase family protein n=1 Tax=Paenibacillus sp. 481 TaxID=2835869 RepID=UPI001E3AF9C5|nr:O-antigen ligase family protein [Paenibacillus sp. 481]UHA74752.1 O-antigen ligase family protein [Paenibacillus sp. 481]
MDHSKLSRSVTNSKILHVPIYEKDELQTRSVAVAGVSMLIFILLRSLWSNGLFFDRDMLPVALILLLFAVGLLLYKVVFPLIRLNRSTYTAQMATVEQADHFIYPHSMVHMAQMPLMLYFPFYVAVCYGAALLLEPASMYGTELQLIRWSMYTAWVIVWWSFLTGNKGHTTWKLFYGGIGIVGLVSSLASLCMLYGIFAADTGVMRSDNEQISALGFRLAGWVQYPNALGAIAGSFALLHLFAAVQADNRYKWLLATIPLVPHLTVLGLTESRGAWLVMLVVWGIGTLTMKKQRIAYIGWSIWFMVISFAAVSGTAALWLQQSSLIALPFLLLWVGSIVASLYIGRKGVLVRGVIIGLLLVVGLALLPAHATDRLTEHYETAGARTLIYADAFQLWQVSPWFGSGGDAWRQQFASIQSEPYVGKEVHSSVLDLLLDIGLVGTLPALGLACWALVSAWRRHVGMAMAATTLTLHSVFDFDMAYGFIVLLWLSFLILAISYNRSEERVEWIADHSVRGKMIIGKALMLVVPLAVVALLGVCHLVAQLLTAATSDGINGSSAVGDASNTGVAVRNKAQLHAAALRLTPANTALRIAVASRLPAPEAATLLAEGLRYERSGKQLYRELALAFGASGRPQDAVAYWEAAIQSDRYDRALQTEAVEQLAAQALAAARRGEQRHALILAQGVEQLFAKYEAEVRHLEAMPHPANDKKFMLTADAERAMMSVQMILLLSD